MFSMLKFLQFDSTNNVDHHVTVTFSNHHARTSHANSMAYNERIATAIADLKS
jgi:hypothetical protein